MQHVFIHPAGQDDNLGDSALRAGLLGALRSPGVRLHVFLEGQSSDYHNGIPVHGTDVLYGSRREWLKQSQRVERPVIVINPGEINPNPDVPYPHPSRLRELRPFLKRGGKVIAAGLGVKDPLVAAKVRFDPILREASVMSWRDGGSSEAVGFGDVAPDWALSLGTDSPNWQTSAQRDVLAVTLRFDRAWPSDKWLASVRGLATNLGLRIVTVAQVSRDAPRAVRLAEALEGEYVFPPSMSHDDLDAYVRAVYSRSVAVVSDRAHALIMGATEGAYPLGSAVDPQKIRRLLDTIGAGALTGHHDDFQAHAQRLESELGGLALAVDSARATLVNLTARIREQLESS